MNLNEARERCMIIATAVSETEKALSLERLATARCEATLAEVTKAFSELRRQAATPGFRVQTSTELFERLVAQDALIAQLQKEQSFLQKQLAGQRPATGDNVSMTDETAELLLKLQDAFKLVWELTQALEKALATNADTERYCQRREAALKEKEKALDELEQLSDKERNTQLRDHFQKEREEAKRFDTPKMFYVTQEKQWFGALYNIS